MHRCWWIWLLCRCIYSKFDMNSCFLCSCIYSKFDMISSLVYLVFAIFVVRVHEIDMLISLSLAFYVESWWGPAATVGIFIAAATTDWLDGYLARKVLISTFKFLGNIRWALFVFSLFSWLTCYSFGASDEIGYSIWCIFRSSGW